MAQSDKPPDQSPDREAHPLSVPDPVTGEQAQAGDMRAEFERLSRQVPRDPDAERAFIESKIEIVRSDPQLSDDEKQRAVEELQRRL